MWLSMYRPWSSSVTNPLQGYQPSHAEAEAEAFGRWLLATAQAAADSAKEGGFMGFGAQQVSQGEQAMLDQVRAAVGE